MAWLIKKKLLIFLGNEALLQQSFSCEALPQQSSKSRKIFLRPFQNFQRIFPKHRHRFIQFSKWSSMLHPSCLALPGYSYNSACAFPFLSPFYYRCGQICARNTAVPNLATFTNGCSVTCQTKFGRFHGLLFLL